MLTYPTPNPSNEDSSLHLYNLEEDPAEVHDLAPKNPELTEELNRELEAYLHRIGAGFPIVNPEFSPDADPALAYPGVKEKLMQKPYFVTK